MRRVNTQAGVTLVELMIAVVISGIAISAALAMGYSMMNGYRDHQRLVMTQRSARVSLDIIADAIRNSSPGVSTGNIENVGACSVMNGLAVTNNVGDPDELTAVYAVDGVVTTSRTIFTNASTTVTVLDPSQIDEGDSVMITNFDSGHVFDVDTKTGSTLNLSASPITQCPSVTFPAGDYAVGSLILKVRAVRFYVDSSATVGGVPTLMMDPDGPGVLEGQPMAEGVEDLQIAVGVDTDDNDILFEDGGTTDEWYYNVSGDLAPPLITATPWRALRITLVARTVIESASTGTNTRPAVEDRAASVSPDPYRRRLLTTTVEIRNLEGSP